MESGMETSNEALFEAFLNQHDDQSWGRTVAGLSSLIHEVDRDATRIWFYFYPLAVSRALRQTENAARLASELCLDGRYHIEDQIDSSHRFLYGHRYWPEVKVTVAHRAASGSAPNSLDLATQIRDVASEVAHRLKVDCSLVAGITAVAFMTLQQVGFDAFRSDSRSIKAGRKSLRRSPQQILNKRKNSKSRGLFGFLLGDAKLYTVIFDEADPNASFKLINSQHLTTAAASDKREYHEKEPRCVVDEGPIPVQCRSAACGSCWVGVLGGAQALSDVAALERRRIREFGYIDSDDPKPLIRLACQAQAFGNVTIVIPPWNGVFGKLKRESGSTTEEASTNSSR